MWYYLGQFILKNRLLLLVSIFLATCVMGYFSSRVQLSYDFTRAVPTDNPRYIEYQEFLKKFGADNNTMVLGMSADSGFFYRKDFFNAVGELHQHLKNIPGVMEVLSVPEALNLVKDNFSERLLPVKIFNYPYTSQTALDSARANFENLPFYKGLLYNPQTNSYLLGIGVNKDTINSKGRTRLIADIMHEVEAFETHTKTHIHTSGLPFIRTTMSNRIKDEMNWFLIGSLAFSAITLLLFFRSFSAMLISLAVVGMGVIFSLGTVVLFGYKITLLTALIPPLIVVIGIPNCIYFLNKYHSSYKETGNKKQALINMVGKMGVVTLFCNIAAAIGFGVFALTRSDLLKEFGIVAGINIMVLFLISLLFIPAVLSYLPAPKQRHIRYLNNPFLEQMLVYTERWAFRHTRKVYLITAGVCILAIAGMFRLKSEGFIVDDLPKTNRIYTDLKWFEKNFVGVMPLEIVVDTQKKKGILRSAPIAKIEELSQYISTDSTMARPLSFVEGLKFAKQAYFNGDSMSYTVPYEGDLVFMAPYLRAKTDPAVEKKGFAKLMNNFMDSSQQTARISVNMKDIGSAKLPVLIARFEKKAHELFDSTYKVSFTGSSISFLEGSGFIIRGLKESIVWAFVLITLCMLYLFRSFRILVCSLIPNLVPLLVTAGVMGWAGIALKPSTVLVFSVALGIVIDVTIRFLINYKQELPHYNNQVKHTLAQTIKHTGISIVYTSLVLVAGFVIFCFSDFGGTKALGWLTSLTLVVGTITNLLLLPVLILSVSRRRTKE